MACCVVEFPLHQGQAVSFREMLARNAERLKQGLSSEGTVRCCCDLVGLPSFVPSWTAPSGSGPSVFRSDGDPTSGKIRGVSAFCR